MSADGTPRTVIVGGGIAALEAILALRDLAGERTELTLVSPEPDFTYKPLIVEEPFSQTPADHLELPPILADLGGEFVAGAAESFDTAERRVVLSSGDELGYDFLVVCVGGRARDALANAITFRVVGEPLEIDSLIDQALAHPSKRLAFVAPPGVTWSLPLYELALMSRRRAEESGREDLRIVVVTPEESPLILFGRAPSDSVAELLRARKVEFEAESLATDGPGGIVLMPGRRELEAGAVVALPAIEGRSLSGLPSDRNGFIPIDDHARIVGTVAAYAAGDGTNFPIKQGGLATQQADAAAADIAAKVGADVEETPFHPVLRGQLIVGEESLNLRHDVTGGHGEGMASLDYLWWPPHKVSGRYLAPWLAEHGPHAAPPVPAQPMEISVAMPLDWHEDPASVDPYGPIEPD